MFMLTGEYNHQLDAKNRMRIPAKLKKELGDEYYFAKGSNHCIYVFSKETVEQQFESLKDIKLSDLERQKSVRAFAKSFVPAVEDGQGRVILSPELRKHANMEKDDKDLVICGAVSRVEIWSKKVYDEYFNGEDEDYDNLISMLDI
ncbi:MAG: division/cell wall cluster transcriptional repressor MraZ [Clostridia bacterium]|nr:division/cell wall cluster transcriptional repressor MraZ [Clostridia bacterium]MDE6790655.1 division/cell wall cluster transcriptional repressor MraZ [Clostridia bacterium]